MTIKELYDRIGGNYDQAVRVMKSDRLIDKYVRKLTASQVAESLAEAGKTMDPVKLFESAHAMKGVCSNLGLEALANAVNDITEEFRPGNARKLSDDDVRARLDAIARQYRITAEGIRDYEQGK
ncbi:MAG: Hpt domain-containing protein [Clostridia bacterium]|nr:Hpt domain-containing protein [Clostridia bacterium]